METKELVISAGTSRSDIYSEAEELFWNEAKEGEMVNFVLHVKMPLYLVHRESAP